MGNKFGFLAKKHTTHTTHTHSHTHAHTYTDTQTHTHTHTHIHMHLYTHSHMHTHTRGVKYHTFSIALLVPHTRPVGPKNDLHGK